ncbi:SLAP domain-containing protein [Virgibacillus dokdonensis]|uniref:SLAP domain-containing protein n=1 Tax=Virgibacillus dokdonensis TaxID=302167 RepID=A0A2K9IYC3_9BACI|nr:SLAP domain-containing protein [Virgibacillus dokdonensis]AUJ24729.1 hypothetical protein A21D_01648 [Virgibacillus dokdonensis]
MQRLLFEASWEKTIDARDREEIEKVFEQVKEMKESRQSFFILSQARNHRNDLLVTVLIQNGLETDWVLCGGKLTYYEANKLIATEVFSDKRLIVPAKCSMPWTFIFPESSVQQEPNFKKGTLQMFSQR